MSSPTGDMDDMTIVPGTFVSIGVFGQGMLGNTRMLGHSLSEGWYPCEHPERPTDDRVFWHYQDGNGNHTPCHGCRIAAEALLRRNPGHPSIEWLVDRLQSASSEPPGV
ncbi:hypothetical protein K6U06_06530 [Acidiferrimicrobium sp. IK]|uniref:hypothetical protein n=1 Tax=Acidiferrimicrobium sp. IK TaxID=2871700 RepID=UPI0021CB8D1B|nr:hypothetical protein [Acidiferrimicrobium sp. IK]MCU4184009.1 hypothetical protein [Acidiferrimicrobium sp. IK]